MDIATHRLTCIEQTIDYVFNNRDLLEEAFTHSSYNPTKNNERLEFVGDKVQNTIIGVHLFENYNVDEGILSKLTSYFVDNKRVLPRLCVSYGFDKLIKITDYEKNTKNSRKNWVPSLWEALIGAVFIDSGKDWSTTEKVILHLYGEELILDDERIKDILRTDPVTVVKEHCDEFGYFLEFDEKRVGGFDHDPEHVGYVWINGEEYQGDVARGSKQKARENACEKVISILGLN
ncbi:ribonuclease III family protein [Methanolobus profundi]|uniref:RNAse III n=1 Tax=Methanolobus profundi TaxID=487685 RepID=A0A1I4V1G8_9EURY|nr:ribonuclease III domain-containing protein [Methanolobus profundi]SFM94577.1 ribonuclease-3 [Methanolobus profundi]SFM95074.1 RNAse III [Methanolobus profundi]